MGRASPAIAAFNAGEFAPQMEGRMDVEKYPIASHIQQNFISLKQGPSTFRQGTAYVQPTKTSVNRSWLVRFEFSQTQAFVLEFGDLYVRFYSNHGPVLNAGAIYEIVSPYAAADLTDSLGEFTLQIQQSGDVLYIAGGQAGTGAGYPPYTLTRFSNVPPVWTFAPYLPTDGPFMSPLPLVPGAEIELGVSEVTGTITITAYGGNVFAATDVGRLVRIGSQVFNTTPWATATAFTLNARCTNNGNNYIALNAATTGGSPPVHGQGAVLDGPSGVRWLYTDSGYGVAQVTAYTSPTAVTAKVILQFPINVKTGTATITAITQANPAVLTTPASTVAGDSVFLIGVVGMTQINGTPYTSQVTGSLSVTLANVNSTAYSAYVSGGTMVVNASTEWQLGAWSNTTEWPRAVAFFKDRLFWAGRLNVWGSVPGLYSSMAPDFFGQQTTDSAMNELVTGSDTSNICWLSSATILLIGTEGGEYGLDSANYSASPLGPANVEILRQSSWRCRHIAPWLIGASVLYVQRAGRKVLAMDYNFYLNRYDSTDQSKYAYHISVGGITSLAYMQEPWSILWATRADGTLLAYTFNREDNVTAWTRHNLGNGGKVESLAVIPSPDGLRDELWMIVNRTVNGLTTRTVEYLVKHFEGPQGGQMGDLQSSAWYVDCGVQSNVAPPANATTTTITGLPAVMWNQTVAVLADGGVQPQQVVTGAGSITLTGAFTVVTIGFPYQGNLVPMRFEGGADVGTAQGKKKQGANLTLRLVDAGGGWIGQLSNQTAAGIYQDPLGQTTLDLQLPEYIRYNDTTTGLNVPPAIQSGDYATSFPANPSSDQDASDYYNLVQQNDPLPMTVVGLFPDYKVEENQ